MAIQITDMPGDVVPYAPKKKNGHSEVDLLDRAGNAILGLVNRAANTTEANLQEARDAAEKLADQLRAAHDQIDKLEANVRYYQDRTNRAEKWLQQISSEIEQRFFDATGRRPASRNLAPAIEELIEGETQQIAAKRASRN